MGRFRCACGAEFRDEEAPDASLVAFTLPALGEAESRIAAAVDGYLAAGDRDARAAWLQSYFGSGYPGGIPDSEIVEDIVSRELNEEFTAMFRCPSCGRISLCVPNTQEWITFSRE